MKDDLSNPRRDFLGAMALGLGALSLESVLTPSTAHAAPVGPLTPNQFRRHALQLRTSIARSNAEKPAFHHVTNGDEERYPNKIANYSKGLKHTDTGEVVLSSYSTLIRALSSGVSSRFEEIDSGGVRAQIAPQSGLSYELHGGDARIFALRPPPQLASREQAAEMAECYWMAVLRDVPFELYAEDAAAHAAAAELTAYGADARVPKLGSSVTPDVLFRGLTAGDRVGPYVSQLLYMPCSFGAHPIDRQFVTYAAGVDFMTTFDEWLAIQRGAAPTRAPVMGPKGYIVNGRDLGRWVHVDFLYQAFLFAGLSLSAAGAPLNPANPYRGFRKQIWINLFNELAQVCGNALRATMYQKWYVHRRLRPEVFGARIHRVLHAGATYPIHESILDSLESSNGVGGYLPPGNALLSQAFPEGSPTHPAYPAAHAVIAGACTTVLKAIFDGSWTIPRPKQPNLDGTELLDYTGPALTAGGELDKLASNISLGRNIAGVHWRSDATDGLELGEDIAIQLLAELRLCHNEDLHFTLTKFDGTSITI
jgi:hypothetical protein